MNEINTKEYASQFCDMVEKLMQQFEYVGDWSWGDPAGLGEPLPTYEVSTSEGNKVWCAIEEYVNSGTGVPNRKGVLATYPSETKKSPGALINTVIPYEFSRTFNTRAYAEGSKVEIRDYGKHTVGRAGLTQEDFFKYMEENHAGKVLLDEEDKKYVNVFSYDGSMKADKFASQLYEFVSIIAEYKKQYR